MVEPREAKDLNNIAISRAATDVAERICNEQERFSNLSDVLTYAAAWMIRNGEKDFDPIAYKPTDASGTNHAFGTLDKDGTWSKVITLLYPETTAPYICLRSLMDKGLLEIGERMDADPSFNLFSDIES